MECLRTIHEYFSKSTRRKNKLREYLEQKNAGIRENQRQTARQARRLLEREVRNPDDALENSLKVLEEQHKLPRRIIMTRWLSSVDAIKVLVTSRTTYQDFFQHETTRKGEEMFEWIHDNTVFGWYYCLIDVIPVLTGLNILFQSSLPVPHLLYPRIQLAKITLINMVCTEGMGGTRTELLSKDMVDQDTKFGACHQIFGRRILYVHCEGAERVKAGLAQFVLTLSEKDRQAIPTHQYGSVSAFTSSGS
jgi:hypothetical protein